MDGAETMPRNIDHPKGWMGMLEDLVAPRKVHVHALSFEQARNYPDMEFCAVVFAGGEEVVSRFAPPEEAELILHEAAWELFKKFGGKFQPIQPPARPSVKPRVGRNSGLPESTAGQVARVDWHHHMVIRR